MAYLNINTNIAETDGQLEALAAKQMPFALATALNETSKTAILDLKRVIPTIFDRPKPFTVNSLFLKRATKGNLVATIFHSDAVSRYIEQEIEGGERGIKPFEKNIEQRIGGSGYFVPGPAARLDAYGNVPRSVIQQITAAADQPDGDIAFIPYGNKTGHKPGIYLRIGRKVKLAGRGKNRKLTQTQGSLRAILLAVDEANYKPRYNMEYLVHQTVTQDFDRELAYALEQAITSAK